MAIDEAYADRNLSAAYVAFKRFKEENPWVTHANIKTECASAEVWLARALATARITTALARARAARGSFRL
eukprot:6790672-Prymnesium_polylepis.1